MLQTHTNQASTRLHDEHWARVNQRRSHIEQLEDDITELAAHIDAASFRLLELIGSFDQQEGWHGTGILSSATAPALPYLLHPCSRVPTG